MSVCSFIKSLFTSIRFKAKSKFINTSNIIWNADENELFNVVNGYRRDNGLALVEKSDPFYELASQRVDDCIEKGRISHDKFGESLSMVKVPFKGIGENLAYGYVFPYNTFLGWLNSDDHDRIMLGGWLYTGVSIKILNGRKYYCQIFAK